MKTINVTCRELFDNFADNFKEYFWCEPDGSDKINAQKTLRTLRTLCKCENKDKAGIVKLRGYFAGGDTVFLMGSKMKELDTAAPWMNSKSGFTTPRTIWSVS